MITAKQIVKKNLAKLFISLLITLFLGGFIVQYTNFEKFLATFQNIHWFYFLLSIGLFILYQYIRRLRFQLLINASCNQLHLLNTQCIHSAARNILPIGLGEAAFVYLMKRFYRCSYHETTAAIIIAKMLDLLILLFLSTAFVVFLSATFQKNIIIALFGLLLLLLISSAGIFLLLRIERNRRLKKKDFKNSFLSRNLTLLASSIRTVIKKGMSYKLGVYSIAMITVMYFFYVSLFHTLGLNLKWHVTAIAYLVAGGIGLLPIKGLANIGTFEAPWFIVLTSFNLSTEKAAIASFGVHILLFVSVFISLIISTSLLIISKNLHKPLQ